MDSQSVAQIASAMTQPVTDPTFCTRAFTLAVKTRKHVYAKDGDNIRRICTEEYDDFSRRMDKVGLQDACSARNILRTRRLANLLISDEGELNAALLPRISKYLTDHLYSLGPDRQYDAHRQEHILHVIRLLTESKELVKLLKHVGKPFSHKQAEQLIRDTLNLPAHTLITDAHARRAALAGWMCYLRQNVGSCFATAPAIIVHEEQPHQYLKDISELLSSGRLKRTFGGVEYSVPLSSSWGTGDLFRTLIFSKNIADNTSDVWLSPGLVAAFEAVGVLNTEETLQHKVLTLKDLINKLIQEWETNQPYLVLTPDQIIRLLLLKHMNLTQRDIEEYENRPKEMIHGGLLMHMSRSPVGSGGKGEVCANFLSLFEQAKNAFKAVVDNALLKSWEFTLASFSETKLNFTRWNLYSSLGLGSQEEGGIGHTLYHLIKAKLDETNQKVQEFQVEYETLYPQLKYLEARMRSASTEQEIRWMKVEYQSKVHEFYTFEEMRNETNDKARRYAHLYDVLIDIYDGLFPKYFQEVYDADIHDVSHGPYDDSPAGFRLLYKHGRANTSQWTFIKNHTEFVEALVNFFVITEPEVSASPNLKGLEDDVGEVTTAIVSHLKTPLFLETAFHRMAFAHKVRAIKDPLENLEKIEKKPWVYTSGGSMETLVNCYFAREQKPTASERWVENPIELLVFIIDCLKQQPAKQMDVFLKNPQKSMLMHSPTHAFLLKPGLFPLKDAWQTDAFTYTWVRDRFVKPMENFLGGILLDEAEMEYIVQYLMRHVQPEYKPFFQRIFSSLPGRLSPSDFRYHILHSIELQLGVRYGNQPVLAAEEIDSALFSLLPFVSSDRLASRLNKLLAGLPGLTKEITAYLSALIEKLTGRYGEKPFIGALELQNLAKALLTLSPIGTSSAYDYPALISKKAQELGYAFPKTIAFADSNWVKDHFGFLVNPGTGNFELWRVDYTGTVGYPMPSWNQWLNGSKRDPKWGIYTRPYEYTS